jgi:subtilisin family serine protease
MVFTKALLRAIRKPNHFQTVPVIVELKPDAKVAPMATQISQLLKIDVGQTIPFVNSFSMVIPTEMLSELGGINQVQTVHYDSPMFGFQSPLPPPPDPLGIMSGGPLGGIGKKVGDLLSNPDIMISINTGWIPTGEANKGVKLYELHKKGITGQGVKVWVLDTGVDITNPQLQGVINGAHSSTVGAPNDANGHGSWCASRIVGQLYTHPVYGLDLLGAAPECIMNTCKVLTDLGFGNTSDILKGMQMALDAKADIISMSLGGEGDAEGEEEDLMTKFINKAAETNPMTLFVIAAGNSGAEGEKAGRTIGIPANAEEAITVGSWSILDQARAYYSSTGPTLQVGRMKPDILGQGGGRAIASGYKRGMGDIFSGSAFGSQLDPLDKLADGFCPLKGTSMATPEVAGILALWKQLVPQLTARDVKAIFNKFGLPKSTDLGHGLIDATWILQAIG